MTSGYCQSTNMMYFTSSLVFIVSLRDIEASSSMNNATAVGVFAVEDITRHNRLSHSLRAEVFRRDLSVSDEHSLVSLSSSFTMFFRRSAAVNTPMCLYL